MPVTFYFSYPEKWRDRPFEASATRQARFGGPGCQVRQTRVWEMRGKAAMSSLVASPGPGMF